MKKTVFLMATAAFMAGAQAQVYGELGYTSVKFKSTEDGDTYKSSPNAIRGIVGYDAYPNLAIEGMLAFGMGSANVSGPDVPNGMKLKVDNAYGLFLKPKTKLNDKLEVFGRLGYTKAKYKISYLGRSTNESDDSLSYGAGLNYAIASNISLNLDYVQYVKDDVSKSKGITFGIGYKF
jgi:outer membrane autotransporter protein